MLGDTLRPSGAGVRTTGENLESLRGAEKREHTRQGSVGIHWHRKVAKSCESAHRCPDLPVMDMNRQIPGPGAFRFDAVLFDFGGTLDAEGEPAVEQFFRAYRAAGGQRSAREFEPIFRDSDRQLAADSATRTRGLRDTLLEQTRLVAALAGDAKLDAAAMAAAVHAAVRAAADRNIAVLRTIRERGMRIGVVSNFTGNLDRCLAELGIAPLVDVVIDSAVVGVRKPDPTIFGLALQQLGVGAPRALMVGDNPFADICAAASLGMSTCWLAPLARPLPDGCAPTIRIARLTDLLAHLDVARTGSLVAPCTG